jgi:hypothetical protein
VPGLNNTFPICQQNAAGKSTALQKTCARGGVYFWIFKTSKSWAALSACFLRFETLAMQQSAGVLFWA